MNFLKMIILTLAVTLGTYVPTQAQNQQARGGTIIIILEGRTAQQFDYQLNCVPSPANEDVAKELLIFDDKGNCIYRQTIVTEIVTVSLHELDGTPYRFLLVVGDLKIEGIF